MEGVYVCGLCGGSSSKSAFITMITEALEIYMYAWREIEMYDKIRNIEHLRCLLKFFLFVINFGL